MPPEVEPGAPGAYGGAGTIDGKVPGKLWINLAHAQHLDHLQPARRSRITNPFRDTCGKAGTRSRCPCSVRCSPSTRTSEGWALYAEQLATELGVYDNDSFGRLGYLQSIAFRACRLVVDTGLHAKRWTPRAGHSMVRHTPTARVSQRSPSEVDRYCAWPGQACGYKVGHSEINRLRTQAQKALGNKFDLRQFNDTSREMRRCADGRAGSEHRRVHREAEVIERRQRRGACMEFGMNTALNSFVVLSAAVLGLLSIFASAVAVAGSVLYRSTLLRKEVIPGRGQSCWQRDGATVAGLIGGWIAARRATRTRSDSRGQ